MILVLGLFRVPLFFFFLFFLVFRFECLYLVGCTTSFL